MQESDSGPAKATQVGGAHGVDWHAFGLPQLGHPLNVHGVVLLLGGGVVRLEDGPARQGVAPTLAQHLLLLIWAQLHATHHATHASVQRHCLATSTG